MGYFADDAIWHARGLKKIASQTARERARKMMSSARPVIRWGQLVQELVLAAGSGFSAGSGNGDGGKDQASMKVVATPAEEDLPDVEVLLREGSFQQRMEAARKQRERVLALRSTEPDQQFELTTIHQPWGKNGWGTPSQRPPAAAPAGKATIPALTNEVVATVTRLPAAVPMPDTRSPGTAAASRSRFTIVRTAIGFALGLGLGIVVATSVPYFKGQNQTQVTAAPSSAPQPGPADGAPLSAQTQSAVAGNALLSDGAAITVPSSDATIQTALPVPAPPTEAERLPTADITDARPILQGLGDWLPQAPGNASLDTGEAEPALSIGDGGITVRLAPSQPEVAALSDLPAAALAPPLVADTSGVRSASIHILLSKGDGESVLSPLTAQLVKAGFNVTATAETGTTIRETNVRYYHPADAEAAKVLAAELDVTARDFTNVSPSPPAGLIEVWLRGSAVEKAPVVVATKAKAKAKKKKSAVAPAVDPAVAESQELQLLRDRLLKQLTNGTSP